MIKPLIIRSKFLLLAVVSLLGSFAYVFVFNVSAVSAKTCVTNGSPHGYAGIIVNSRYKDYETGNFYQSNNTTVLIDTYGSTSSPPGNVVRLGSGPEGVAERRNKATFDQINLSYCDFNGVGGSEPGDKTNVVLGDNISKTSSPVGESSKPWAEDCDVSLNGPGNEQQMEISGKGTPSGARGGGSWNSKIVRPKNGETTFVTVTYIEPPPPVPPNYPFRLVPAASVDSMDNEDPSSNVTYSGSVAVAVMGPPGPGYVNTSSSLQLIRRRSGTPDQRLDMRSHSGRYYNYTYPPATVNPSGSFNVGDQICAILTISQASGTAKTATGNPNPGSPPASATSTCQTVVNKPYLRAYGADVVAGSGFKPSCPFDPASPPRIRTYTKRTGGKSGSGSELAALSIGPITGFISASLRSAAPARPVGLSFSNTSGVDLSNTTTTTPLGGNFGAVPCATDFYTDTQFGTGDPNKITYTPGTMGVAGKQTTHTGNITLSGGTITGRRTLYVNGDVTITGNISYSGSSSWANIGAIPSFTLVVKGNIRISNGVSNLDGLYIAQSNGALNTGEIFTCTNRATCNSTRLIVNGAFIANRVHFWRTFGTLRNSSSSIRTATDNNAAELFLFSPEIYLSPPLFKELGESSSGGSPGQYDFIVNLPPVL